MEENNEAGQSKGNGGGMRDFLEMVISDRGKPLARKASLDKPAKDILGVDSPQNLSGSGSSLLAQQIVNIFCNSLNAHAVAVAVLHPATNVFRSQHSSRLAETIVATPIDAIPEVVSFNHSMLSSLTGQVVSTESMNLPLSLRKCLHQPPTSFEGVILSLQDFQVVFYAMWSDDSLIKPAAHLVFARAARCVPLMLANRASARKIERVGRQFDAILKSMPQAVVFVDDELAQVVVNPAAASLLELPTFGEVDPVKVASSMRQLAERSGSRDDLQKWFSMVASTADSVIHEEWHLTKPRRVLRVESYPVTSAVNSAHGRLWMFEDLTVERNAREAIAAANHAKSQFLATMSHELRTPMTGVLGMLELLKLTGLNAEQRGLLGVMQSSAEGLMTTINDILDFCKMEAGRLMLEDIPFQVSEILAEVQKVFEPDVEKKSLALKIQQPHPQYQRLRGDPVRLKQILVNLVSNAVKFTSVGSVALSWHQRDPPPFLMSGGADAASTAGQWGREWSPGQRLSLADRAKTWPPRQMERAASDFLREAGAMEEEAGREEGAEKEPGNSGSGDVNGAEGAEEDRPGSGKWTAEDYAVNPSSSGPGSDANSPMSSSPVWNPIARSATVNVCDLSRVGQLSLRHSSMATSVSVHSAREEDEAATAPCPACGSSFPYGDDAGPANQNGTAGEHSENGPEQLQEPCSQCGGRTGVATGVDERASARRDAEQAAEEQENAAGSSDERVWFRIIVTDTGCGMSRAKLANLFDGSKTPERWREQDGTGLGLAICKGLLSLMGGCIWADSEPGRGSMFSVAVPLLLDEDAANHSLPPGTPDASNTASPTAASPAARPFAIPEDLALTVLVAEDNKVNQLLIRRILKHYGHEVELVGNGKLALEAIQKKRYDMILMDLQMPVLDGLSATKAIRELPLEVSKIPIYALTADAMAAEIEESGMDGFLSKPIVWEKLSHVVDKVLAAKAERGDTES